MYNACLTAMSFSELNAMAFTPAGQQLLFSIFVYFRSQVCCFRKLRGSHPLKVAIMSGYASPLYSISLVVLMLAVIHSRQVRP